MKFLGTLSLFFLLGSFSSAEERHDFSQKTTSVTASDLRGCYIIPIKQLFFTGDFHLHIPGDGTFTFWANTKKQGPMSKKCIGTVKMLQYKASAQIDCSEMLKVSKNKDGKPYRWEKNFQLALDVSEARKSGDAILNVHVTNTQGSNGDQQNFEVDLRQEPCK